MDVTVVFSTDRMTRAKKDAVEIAQSHNSTEQNGMYKVKFDKRCQDLAQLLDLSMTWKLSHVLIGNEKFSVSDVWERYNCEDRRQCDGKCEYGRSNYVYLLDEIEKCVNGSCDEDSDGEWMVETISDLDMFEKQGERIFKINKEMLKKSLEKQYVIPKNVCDKFDFNKLLEQIGRLPDSFTVPNSEEDEEYEVSFFDRKERERLIEKAKIVAPILAEAFAKEMDKVILANFGSEKTASACALKGDALYDLDRVEESLECYNKALEMEGTNSEYWFEKGLILELGQGNLEAALDSYSRAFELDSENIYSLHRKGICLDSLGKEKEAVAIYKETIRLYEKRLVERPFEKETKEHLKWVRENLSAFEE